MRGTIVKRQSKKDGWPLYYVIVPRDGKRK